MVKPTTGRCGRHPADCQDPQCPTHGVKAVEYVALHQTAGHFDPDAEFYLAEIARLRDGLFKQGRPEAYKRIVDRFFEEHPYLYDKDVPTSRWLDLKRRLFKAHEAGESENNS